MHVLSAAVLASALGLSLHPEWNLSENPVVALEADAEEATKESSPKDTPSETPVSPDGAASTTSAFKLTIPGSWQFAGHGLSAFPINSSGTSLGQHYYADHRLRVSPKLELSKTTTLYASFDLLKGVFAGDPATTEFRFLNYDRGVRNGYLPTTFDFREAYLEWKPGIGVLRVGQMSSYWGLGLLANNGSVDQPWGGPRFHGDLVDRVMFATRPGKPLDYNWRHFVLVLAADMVFRDQSAQLLEGDRAFQGVVAFVYAPEENNNRLGVYAVRRSQTDRDGFGLNIWAFDAHGRWVKPLGKSGNTTLRLEAEVAHVRGDTTAVRDWNNSRRQVRQLGAAAEAGLSGQRWEALLQTGVGSGDKNPYDDVITSFEFDPEYRVGFILFQEVLAWTSASSAAQASDPNVTGRPAAGSRLLPTEGAVSNAIYLAPTARFEVFKNFNVQAGLVYARTAADFIDAYTTNIDGGGYPLTPRGATPSSRELGIEADLGVAYTLERTQEQTATFYLQAGRFFPGAAFDAPADETTTVPSVPMHPVNRVLGGVNLSW